MINPQQVFQKELERILYRNRGIISSKEISNLIEKYNFNDSKEIIQDAHQDYLKQQNPLQVYQRKLEEKMPSSVFNPSQTSISKLQYLQQELELEPEDLDLIIQRIAENRQELKAAEVTGTHHRVNLTQLSQRFNWLFPWGLLGILGLGAIIGSILSQPQLSQEAKLLCNDKSRPSNLKRSTGERLLIKNDRERISKNVGSDLQAGVNAFKKCDFPTAVENFNKALELNKNPNDPEARIYLNNAKIADKPTFKIVVSVPISELPKSSSALEILRGVAMAQEDVNNNGGIKGRALIVEIADDNNDVNNVRQLAQEFVDDPRIIAVVGHNSSQASLAGMDVYNKGKLVMVNSTSTSIQLSVTNDFIFRVVLIDKEAAIFLAEYMYQQGLSNVYICYEDEEDSASKSFGREFNYRMNELLKQNRPLGKNCLFDKNNNNFDPKPLIRNARESAFNGLLILPTTKTLDQAVQLMNENLNQPYQPLPIFSSNILYRNYDHLDKLNPKAIKGMKLTAPWYPSKNNKFAARAEKMWSGKVNWRTAMSYDAVLVIVQGLKDINQANPSRQELQVQLNKDGFVATSIANGLESATGKISFDQFGDRKIEEGNIRIVEYNPDLARTEKFVLIK
jgi:branched-chain amino acid transport system substrate-binding protein